ncbi:MAG: Asp-tRNA(Asn)/Glu-tRNA(Gln) amidotransferase subunit GatC [Deltaproteobacteria bacterium]|nr:Asp-tRNA(Asn)/Glu-tRNA(Gln) amidotransferase subunit GatC [Deltaproteobacteria bacterium]
MAITKKDVEHVAVLARLALSEQEIKLYTEQMANILSYVEKLRALDTRVVESTAYTTSTNTVFRKDEMKPSLPQEGILSNAPEKAKGCFKVPRIIE